MRHGEKEWIKEGKEDMENRSELRNERKDGEQE